MGGTPQVHLNEENSNGGHWGGEKSERMGGKSEKWRGRMREEREHTREQTFRPHRIFAGL